MTEENSMSNWFQDNLRIIISVGIVILLVFAIYSYSKRNSRTDVVVDDSQVEEIAMTATEDNNGDINEIIDEITDEEPQSDTVDVKENIKEQEKTEELALEEKIAEEDAKKAKEEEIARIAQEEAQNAQIEQKEAEQKVAAKEEQERQIAKDAMREVIESRSRQKDGVITVTASRGDSATTLARKATAQYISQSNVSGLTPAHKIYIEDYLRKSVRTQQIYPGTTIEYTEAMIAQAIGQSRTLTDTQLQNLDKYAQNVIW